MYESTLVIRFGPGLKQQRNYDLGSNFSSSRVGSSTLSFAGHAVVHHVAATKLQIDASGRTSRRRVAFSLDTWSTGRWKGNYFEENVEGTAPPRMNSSQSGLNCCTARIRSYFTHHLLYFSGFLQLSSRFHR